MDKAPDLTDLAAARPTGKPNDYLVLPRRWGLGPAHRPSPIFPVQAEVLAQTVAIWLAKSPRVAVVARSDDGLQIEAEARSRLFRFIDRISVRAVPRGTDRSALAFFSRARTGYWDLGVNRRRGERLLAALETAVGSVR